MKKRLLALTLALVMALALLPTAVLAANITVTEVAPPRYDQVNDFDHGFASVLNKERGGWGIIDSTGKEVVPCSYAGYGELSEGLMAVGQVVGQEETSYMMGPSLLNGTEISSGGKVTDVNLLFKWGFVDTTGKMVVPFQYDEVAPFSEGLAGVGMDSGRKDAYGERICLWGVIDATGKEIVPCKYEIVGRKGRTEANALTTGEESMFGVQATHVYKVDIDPFREGLMAVCLDGKCGYIDRTGKEVIPLKYDYAGNFCDGFATVELDGQRRYIDKTGKEFMLDYDRIFKVNENGWLVGKGDTWGMIDKTGREVVPVGKYKSMDTFSEGLAAVCRDEKWGYIDSMGNEVVPCIYRSAAPFSEGLAAVRTDELVEKNKWGTWNVYKGGYIDKTGKAVIPLTLEYTELGDFHEGLAVVDCGDGKGYIDTTGAEVIPCQIHSPCTDEWLGRVVVDYYGSGWGISPAEFENLKKNGRMVSHYYDAGDFCQGIARVVQDPNDPGQCMYIDKTGKQVVSDLLTRPILADEMQVQENGLVWQWRDGLMGLVAITEGPAALPSPQTVTVDGKKVEFQCYALKDAAGNDTNYIKLRDVAQILNGSAVQFDVGWDGAVTITTGTAYTPNGTEQNTPFSDARVYQEVTTQTLVDGQGKDLAAITLTDDVGGGYTYYKLRDLGTALGFRVDWSAEKGIFIETK